MNSVDLGIASDKKFEDNFHENILNFITDENNKDAK